MIKHWYELNDASEVDSPALLVYEERVVDNIQKAIEMVGAIVAGFVHMSKQINRQMSVLL